MDRTTQHPLFRPALRREMHHRLMFCWSPVERPGAILPGGCRTTAGALEAVAAAVREIALRHPALLHGEAP